MPRPLPPCLLSALLLLGWLPACERGPDDPFGGITPASAPQVDMSGLDMRAPDLGRPQAVRAFCSPGERRCVGENSPLHEVCSEQGTTWEVEACEGGEVCRDGQCVGFVCVPGRSVCAGTLARAVCGASGRDLENLSPCQGDEICRAGLCIDPCEEAAQEGDYIGCDYVAQRLFNIFDLPGAQGGSSSDGPFAIIAANPSRFHDARVTITGPGGEVTQLIQDRLMDPGEFYQFAQPTRVTSSILRDGEPVEPLDRFAQQVRIPPGAAAVMLLSPNATNTYRLKSSRPVVAYQFNPYCCNFTASNDASLLLPTTSLGTRYRILSYPTMNFESELGLLALHPYFYVIALEDDTQVNILAPGVTRQMHQDYGLSREDGHDFTDQTSLTLQANERRIFLREGSISGASVTSSKPVAVFAGHPCTFAPQDNWACDHLEEQMLPATTLGLRYLLPSIRPRNPSARQSGTNREGIYWRLVADEDARITTEPPLMELDIYEPSTYQLTSCLKRVHNAEIVLAAGESCELGLKDPISVTSTGALLVGGVISGHQSTGRSEYGTQAGDPSLFLAPPLSQYRRDYTFVTPQTFRKTFASITARAGEPISYQGQRVPVEQRLDRTFIQLGDERWETFSLAIDPGVHTLEGEQTFGLVVYAYDDYVSYAFPGGLDLTPRTKE